MAKKGVNQSLKTYLIIDEEVVMRQSTMFIQINILLFRKSGPHGTPVTMTPDLIIGDNAKIMDV